MSEHIGTHMDAPYHFNPQGWTTEQIPLENLVEVPGVVVDISEKCSKDNCAKLEAEDLEKWRAAKRAVQFDLNSVQQFLEFCCTQ